MTDLAKARIECAKAHIVLCRAGTPLYHYWKAIIQEQL